MRSIVLASILALSAVSAKAELMNISATAMYTGNQRALACTIVDTGTTLSSGIVLIFAFAEGNGAGDPGIRVWSLYRNLSISNESWEDGFTLQVNGQTAHVSLREIDTRNGNPYASLLRSPMRKSDAAVVIPALPGEAICAESYDRSGAAPSTVSLAFTDINAIVFKSAEMKMGRVVPNPVTPDTLEEMARALRR